MGHSLFRNERNFLFSREIFPLEGARFGSKMPGDVKYLPLVCPRISGRNDLKRIDVFFGHP